MFKPSKKDMVFFDLFSTGMKETLKAAEILEDLFINFNNIDEKIKQIEEIEHNCDINVHNILENLNRSFITPIDREDIFLIAKEMDNITDFIDSTAHRITLFNITGIRKECCTMTRLITQSVNELCGIFDELKKLKTSKIIHEKIVEVNRIENQADVVYRKIMKEMFSTETNAIELIKWKEIYEYVEKTIDSCEDVANIIEGIVTKNV